MSSAEQGHIRGIHLAEPQHAQEQRLNRHGLRSGYDLDPGDMSRVVGQTWVICFVLVLQDSDDPNPDASSLIDDNSQLTLLVEECQEVDELLPGPSPTRRPLPLQHCCC